MNKILYNSSLCEIFFSRYYIVLSIMVRKRSVQTKRKPRRKPRSKGLTIKQKVNELYKDKRDDKRVVDQAVTLRPTIVNPATGSGWQLYSFVDDLQMETVVAAASSTTPADASSTNGLRKDTKLRLENLSIDLFLALPSLSGAHIPNYSACRFRVVIFKTKSWHYPVAAHTGSPPALDPEQLMPLITPYSEKYGDTGKMYKNLDGDQYLYGKWTCQPQGLTYKILYDKRHMLSYNTVNSTQSVMLDDAMSYSASQKNISIELKKKVQGHEVVYGLSQINGAQKQGRQEIDTGNLFIAIVNDYNPSGAPTGTAPICQLHYRLKYFT